MVGHGVGFRYHNKNNHNIILLIIIVATGDSAMGEQQNSDAEVRARIFREADRLYEEAGRERFPPVADVRLAARADMNTATRIMKEWRRQQTAKPELVQVELPAPLHQAALSLGAGLWTEALELANANLRKAEAEWSQEREDMEGTRVELSQLYEEQQGELERLRQGSESMRSRLAEQDQALVGLRDDLVRETLRAKTAEARAEEISHRADDLKVELQRAHDEVAAMRDELSAIRQSHQGELVQIRAQADQTIDKAKAELSEAKGRSEAQIEDLAGRVGELQQRLDDSSQELFRLKAAVEVAQDQRKQSATEALAQAERFTKVQGERDEARSLAQDASIRAARFEGELASLKESNAQLLSRVGQPSDKPAKSKTPPRGVGD